MSGARAFHCVDAKQGVVTPSRTTRSATRRSPALCGLLWLVAATVLGGCASVPEPVSVPLPVPIPGTADPADALSGRLAVRVDASASAPARSVSAAFDLRGDANVGRLNLASSFGFVLARAHWAPGRVALVTPQGETEYADLDALTREVLGESLPVAALFDWLRGRPWPGAASTPTVPPADAGFEQLGWVVNLARFDEALVSARREREPVVNVRVRLDRLDPLDRFVPPAPP